MTDLQKRSLLKVAALSAVAAAALVGCGKKEEPAPASAPAPAPAAEAPAPKPEPLKIAFAYVGPVGDGGWSFAHDNGRKAIEKEFGDKVVTSFVESVPESADAERVLRDLAGQGNKLIFGTTFGYMESMLKVAEDNKGVKFEHATGYKTAENLRTYDSRTYEGAYMAGIIAGAMTKSNTLGVVGSVPIPEVIRNINSFTLGAQSVNPKIKTKVVWVNEWFSPPKETEAATSLINGGADILFQNTESYRANTRPLMSQEELRRGRVTGRSNGPEGVVEEHNTYNNQIAPIRVGREMAARQAQVDTSNLQYGTEPSRRYLHEPPTGYRRPAGTAALGPGASGPREDKQVVGQREFLTGQKVYE